ncbi:hypothetical protein LINPERHAP1_LOCUS30294 [Linum perenne]
MLVLLFVHHRQLSVKLAWCMVEVLFFGTLICGHNEVVRVFHRWITCPCMGYHLCLYRNYQQAMCMFKPHISGFSLWPRPKKIALTLRRGTIRKTLLLGKLLASWSELTFGASA